VTAQLEPTQLRYGWHIQCAHPGCEHTLSVHNPPGFNGPPALMLDSEHEDWFFHSMRDHGETYWCFCPEHADDAYTWQNDLAAWKAARWQVGKDTHTTLLGRLKEFFEVFALRKQIGDKVAEWVALNPRPLPPWEVAA
jgi:hypothetical protein